MPIDPSIPLSMPLMRPSTSFADAYAQGVQSRALNDERTARAEERRQAAAMRQAEVEAAAKTRALFSRVAPDGQPQPPTPQELAGIIGPDAATKVFTGFEALKTAQWKNEQDARVGVASILGGIEALPSPELRAHAYTGARADLIAKGMLKPGDAPEKYDPAFIKSALTKALSPQQQLDAAKPPSDYTLGDQRFSGATNTPVATAAPKPEKTIYGAPVVAVVNGKRAFVRPGSDGRVYSASTLQPVDAQPEAKESSADTGPLTAIMGPNGPVLVPRSQAIGQRPATSREQGRPVTSGDAGRMADWDTALDDVKVLKDAVGKDGVTGSSAWVLSKIPNWMDPGIGTAAKQKQAVIDRVKQVIGKMLEGGVLRLEDEKKYEKILPTISDAPDLVTSKLAGLEEAITQRRQRFTESLGDAGYDTDRYTARQASGGIPPEVSEALKGAADGIHTLSDGSTWTVRGGRVSK